MNLTSKKFPLLVIAVSGLLALGATACGGSSDGDETARPAPTAAEFPSAEGMTIEELYNEQTPSDLVVSPAASAFEVGKNRYPFGVFEVDGAQVDDAEVALYFAKSPTSPVEGPIPARVDSLETKPAFRSKGVTGPGEATTVYVADDVNFDRNGPWLAMAVIEGEDGSEASRLPSPTVGQFPNVAAVSDKAPVISTPTAASVGGDLASIDTRQPPSSMHDADFKDVVGKEPIVLTFATPALCQSRVCGPVTDVNEQVKAEVGDGVQFLHMEIYNDNDPSKGLRPQLGPYGLQTEPWTFLIGKDGKIKQRIEGAYGVEELTAAVENLKKQSGVS
ncbi:MAG: hypothetical protein WBP55_01575 [Solirubrobacterales bacterium]